MTSAQEPAQRTPVTALGRLRDAAQTALASVGDQLTRLRVRRRIASGRLGEVTIMAYRGWGTSEQLRLRARVLESSGLSASSAGDPWWRNALAVSKRFLSAEIPGAVVEIAVDGTTEGVTTGPEGYADVRLAHSSSQTGWVPVRWTLCAPEGPAPVEVDGLALIPRPDARFGVISDLDDTVVRTGVTNKMSMLRTVLFTNARTRLPFSGVDAFYDALHDGGRNPIFYVSTSPWNLYDVLDEFLRVRTIPPGPMFLTDWGIDERTFGQPDTHEHKRSSIQQVLDTYPELSFVLIGDSGQHDPEIYAEVVAANPGRISAVYVRDIDADGRGREVERIATRLADLGVDLIHSSDTADAAQHAHRLGLISDSQLEQVHDETTRAAG